MYVDSIGGANNHKPINRERIRMESIILLLAMGVCTCLNFVIIISKFRRERYADATLDMSMLAIICFLFSSGINALCIGMIASAGISTYLWFRPVSLDGIFGNDEDE